ncbi:MAG: virginiamycin B lyase family protein [Armatimonadota bacterium]
MKAVRLLIVIGCILIAGTAFGAGPEHLFICPGMLTIVPGASQQFQVFGVDSNGKVTPYTGKVAWSADRKSGLITADGLFKSRGTEGAYKDAVKAVMPDGLTAVATVRIQRSKQKGEYADERIWSDYNTGMLIHPSAVAAGKDGSIYVADSERNCVQKFAASGKFLGQWGIHGREPGNFIGPRGIAVDPKGDVYVADTFNDRIQKFTSDGKFIAQWGEEGKGDGQFRMPKGLAFDSSGILYAADSGNYRIQKFTADGKYIGKLDVDVRGKFRRQVEFIALDKQNNIYVTYDDAPFIRKYSPSGKVLLELGEDVTIYNNGNFEYPKGIAVGPDGRIYIVDFGKNRVQVFDSSGRYISKLNEPDTAGLWGLTAGADGSIYVTDIYGSRVYKYTPSGKLIGQYGTPGGTVGRFYGIDKACADSEGNIYLSNGKLIQKFDRTGRFITAWNTSHNDMAVDKDGSILVADSTQMRKFDPNGRLISSWKASGGGMTKNPEEWTFIDSQGNLYAVDIYKGVIHKFDSAGKFVVKWKPHNTWEKRYIPQCLEAGPDGTVYIADYLGRIEQFDSSGKFIGQFGEQGSREGQINYPHGMFLDKDGSLYVADNGIDYPKPDKDGNSCAHVVLYSRIQKFDPSGKYVTMVRTMGGLTVDGGGNIYSVSQDRISKFAPVRTGTAVVYGKTALYVFGGIMALFAVFLAMRSMRRRQN